MEIHKPVLPIETAGYLRVAADGTLCDCTFGRGGHSRIQLESSPTARVVALDRDPQAAEAARAFETEFPGRFEFYPRKFSELDGVPGAPYAGVLMDIGISSPQLDDPQRGFSFREGFDAPADMRMNPAEGRSAAEFLETAPEAELVEAVRDFGGETAWKRVVSRLLAARGTGRLRRTSTLAALVAEAVWRPGPPPRIHPATRVFQGVRIAVNDEIGELRAALPKAFAALRTGGVLVVISFHSLEDGIVKRFFREMCGLPVDARDNRTQDMRTCLAKLLTRHPVSPGEAEIHANPRSRSARLRALVKGGDPAAGQADFSQPRSF